MTRSTNDKGQTIVRLPSDMAIDQLPYGKTLAIDTGRQHNKLGFMIDSQTILVEKLSSFFAEVPAKKFIGGGGSDFLSRNERKGSIKNRLSFTYNGKMYSVGKRAQSLGGCTGLGEDKTTNLLPRVLAALTLFNIEGDVNLCVTVPFKNAADWHVQEGRAFEQVRGRLTWGVQNAPKKANVQSLMVVPESYYAEKFPRLYDNSLPDFRGMQRVVIDLGYQTVIIGVIDEEDCFDPDLSVCYDGCGLSRYYGWVAEQCGYKDSESPDFIAAVNSRAETFRPQGRNEEIYLADSRELAADQYFGELVKLCTEAIPGGIRHLTLVGGGAYEFGDRLIEEFCGAKR